MTAPASPVLRDVLEGAGLPGAAELAQALQRVGGGPDGDGQATALWKLKTNVYRVEIESSGETRSLILKSCNPGLARRNALTARRWLPAVGLADGAARLLDSAADAQGERIWLIYEDIGDATLHDARTDAGQVGAVVDLLARLHGRSADHAVLPECRHHAGDLGAAYFTANVIDALRGLEKLRPPRVHLSPDQAETRDRLLLHLQLLRDTVPTRTRQLAEHGGPDVLLHGDPWTTNAFVTPGPDGLRARLVDWDHTGVGPAAYDLSTFLLRFPPEGRREILERYRAALETAGGWTLPADWQLNALFETLECARYANRAVWPAVALLVDGAEWAFEELAMVAEWFQTLRPVLPE
jgi:thiamine kinase-like enzyme